MPRPDMCQLRKVEPVGPIYGCQDLDCFDTCVELTRSEKRLKNMNSPKHRLVMRGESNPI